MTYSVRRSILARSPIAPSPARSPGLVVPGGRNQERYPGYRRLDVTLRRRYERRWGTLTRTCRCSTPTTAATSSSTSTTTATPPPPAPASACSPCCRRSGLRRHSDLTPLPRPDPDPLHVPTGRQHLPNGTSRALRAKWCALTRAERGATVGAHTRIAPVAAYGLCVGFA